MASSTEKAAIGSEAVQIETIAIALLTTPLAVLPAESKFHTLFFAAWGIVITLMGIRAMASKAEDPNLPLLTKSLRVSVKLMQLVLLGAVASIAIHAASVFTMFNPLTIFVAIITALFLLLLLLDEIFLGESMDTLKDIADQAAGDSFIGRQLRRGLHRAADQVQYIIHGNGTTTPGLNKKLFLLLLVLFPHFLAISSPIWWIFSVVTGSWGAAIMVLLSSLWMRDITRYLYITYGAAKSLDQFKLKLRWEFIWIAFVGLVLVGTMGYDLTAVV